MDFGKIELTEAQRAFWREVSDFFDEHATEEVFEEERRTGSGHNHALHKALGERGWILPTWSVEEGGAGLDPVREAILTTERRRRDVPDVTLSTTAMTVPVVRAYGSDTLREKVLPGVAAGDINICLGYTEPDGGSDLAGVRTRATRTDDGWIINGAKMFTTGAHNCQYSILVTRSNPDAPKHRGITIFLVPLDRPGVEIQPVHTLGGERTNAVFYDNVFVGDDHRLGPVDQGWAVMSAPLEVEHGVLEADGYSELNGSTYGWTLQKLLWHATSWANATAPDGGTPLDDVLVKYKLAEIATDVELIRNVPGPMGRVISSELLISRSAELLDLVGPVALLPRGAEGAVEDGELEWSHRFAQGTAIYGGTTDIARNIVAQHNLRLPRAPKFG
ncbi:acyl-CoA dehydrogenase family protein [Rhodococcoides kyotonense]|uniref:Acyl-CoA dehydrogenase n=1 Tax=Rhodococcoides kyotonense TaxID=398843 RepID=A0A239M286_9NOCA|nr:acyl-CoA dehydrogenase family protein [Rhodococcus kyotonensis]SNT36765.1 Acyl-CoA dehydrogenase [Rhodococcus kyotonensis]